jgi:hypothetical protein
MSVPEHRPAERIESGEQEGDSREDENDTFGYLSEDITARSFSSRDSFSVLKSFTGISRLTLIARGSFGFVRDTVPERSLVVPWIVCHVELTTNVMAVF